MRSSVVLVALVLATTGAEAASLALTWDYDRSYTIQRFILTATGTGQQQFQVAPSALGACVSIPDGTPDNFCTIVACPAKGAVTAYWVQAQVGETVSPKAIS